MKKFIKIAFLCVIASIILTGCGAKKNNAHQLNEEVTIASSTGNYSIKFTDIKTVNGGVELTYELKNIDVNSAIQKDQWNFMAYDKKGNSIASLPVTTTKTKVSKGNSSTLKIGFAADSKSNYIEVKFFDDYKDTESAAVFAFEW